MRPYIGLWTRHASFSCIVFFAQSQLVCAAMHTGAAVKRLRPVDEGAFCEGDVAQVLAGTLRGVVGTVTAAHKRTVDLEFQFGAPGELHPTTAAIARAERVRVTELKRAHPTSRVQAAPMVLVQGPSKTVFKGLLCDVSGFDGKRVRVSAVLDGKRQEALVSRRQLIALDDASPGQLADALLRWEIENKYQDPRLPARVIGHL